MKALVITLLAGVLAGGALPAKTGDDEDAGDPQFLRIDQNGDGRLSRDEFSAGCRSQFEAMDSDRNGHVTVAEMDAHRAKENDAAIRSSATGEGEAPGRSPGSGVARADGSVSPHEVANANGRVAGSAERGAAAQFQRMDTDGDGRLTAAEHDSGGRARFARLDRDHDGFLSKAECSASEPGTN
jgi:hypothetical protein